MLREFSSAHDPSPDQRESHAECFSVSKAVSTNSLNTSCSATLGNLKQTAFQNMSTKIVHKIQRAGAAPEPIANWFIPKAMPDATHQLHLGSQLISRQAIPSTIPGDCDQNMSLRRACNYTLPTHNDLPPCAFRNWDSVVCSLCSSFHRQHEAGPEK